MFHILYNERCNRCTISCILTGVIDVPEEKYEKKTIFGHSKYKDDSDESSDED